MMNTFLYYSNDTKEKKYKKLYDSNVILKIIFCYDLSQNNRFWIQVYYSNNFQKDNMIILLQNPSDDNKKSNTFNKIINKFKNNNLYSLTIINLFSIIDSNIDNHNYNIIFNNEMNELNIKIIKDKMLQLQPTTLILGSGQHLIDQINKECKILTVNQYIEIITYIIDYHPNIYVYIIDKLV